MGEETCVILLVLAVVEAPRWLAMCIPFGVASKLELQNFSRMNLLRRRLQVKHQIPREMKANDSRTGARINRDGAAVW
jgi:hypothetical protein